MLFNFQSFDAINSHFELTVRALVFFASNFYSNQIAPLQRARTYVPQKIPKKCDNFMLQN